MARTIKFRCWMKEANKMSHWEDLLAYCNRLSVLQMSEFIPMQFTGLLDQNGQEIYEGDILGRETDRNFVCEVMFSSGAFKGLTHPGKNHYRLLTEMMELERSPYVEVIGNIYENQGLLKG